MRMDRQEKELLSEISLGDASRHSDLFVYLIDEDLWVLASGVYRAQVHQGRMVKDELGDARLEKICMSLIKKSLKKRHKRLFKAQQTCKIEYLMEGKIQNSHLEVTLVPMKDGEGKINKVVAFVQDIGERKNLEQELRRLALTDSLTNLYNRQYFDQKLEEELQRVRRYQMALSVIIIDLNNLKYVNDHFGHERGDYLLKATARVVKDSVRDVDIISRHGGDEMAIILPETDAKQVEAVVTRIRKTVKEWNQKNGDPELSLSLSIGWASNSKSGCSMNLVARADKMMYEDKRKYYAGQQIAHRKFKTEFVNPQ